MRKRILLIVATIFSFTLSFAQNEEKYSVTTQMFLQELQEDRLSRHPLPGQEGFHRRHHLRGLRPVRADVQVRRVCEARWKGGQVI